MTNNRDDEFDFREVKDGEESEVVDTTTDSAASDDKSDNTSNNNEEKTEYEDVCFVCRRPESKAGKMFHLPNNICICNDCMQKTMDTVSQFDYQNLLNNPNLMNELNKNQTGFPGFGFFNMDNNNGFNMGGIPNSQKIKKKSEGKVKPAFDIKNIPAPHKIKAKLDEYVIGQDQAKKVMSVAVYNHYKRVATDTMDDIEIEKSNILLLGPTGSGKTYLVKTLAKLLDVPLAIADATSLTEAGYIGDDIESVVSKLLAAAGNDVEKTEHGIIFIDEIDKIAKKKNTTSRDVSGESVQQGMLKLLEGSNVEVPVGAGSKNAMVPLTTVNTRNILFICGGAFPDLEEIITQRLNKQTSIGFDADLKDKYEDDPNILSNVTVEDLKKFGMIPEFLGRLPIICTLQALTKDMLIQILKEPKNAILKQYQKLLALDEVDLQFDDSALEAIAEKALEKDTGARALRAIIEEFMLDIMYEIAKDENIGRVTITRAYIDGKASPLIEIRGDSIQPKLPVFNTEQATSV
ncbi:MAG: ATP-dependent Clp protease ATP-binding subunit ClpX [Butyrivibrio sp.]|nr:ATP-dependent Clp protease ATP-binding subunit ClpX [Butyrivibrio sp.]